MPGRMSLFPRSPDSLAVDWGDKQKGITAIAVEGTVETAQQVCSYAMHAQGVGKQGIFQSRQLDPQHQGRGVAPSG